MSRQHNPGHILSIRCLSSVYDGEPLAQNKKYNSLTPASVSLSTHVVPFGEVASIPQRAADAGGLEFQSMDPRLSARHPLSYRRTPVRTCVLAAACAHTHSHNQSARVESLAVESRLVYSAERPEQT